MRTNLKEMKTVIINEKPYLLHRNGFVVDGTTMKRCGYKNKKGYVSFANNQSLHRHIYKAFADWTNHRTPDKFPGGSKSWKRLGNKEKIDFMWEWCVIHHKHGTAKGNGFKNLELVSGKANSIIGNNFDE